VRARRRKVRPRNSRHADQTMNTSPWHQLNLKVAQASGLPRKPEACATLALSRREFLWTSGGGLGRIALAALPGNEKLLATPSSPGMLGGTLHFPPKAKRVVQLFMAGAASHIDLFDFKPELVKRHGQKSDFGEHVEAFQDGLGPWLRPVWDFKPYGKCGKLLSEVVADLGDVVDDIAFIHNMV